MPTCSEAFRMTKKMNVEKNVQRLENEEHVNQ